MFSGPQSLCLPQKIFHDIDKDDERFRFKKKSMMKDFLWSDHNLKSSGANFSWKFVCSTIEEGDLLFRWLKDWNKASTARNLWAMCRKADTLWVKLVHTCTIKNQSVWSAKIKILPDASWTVT